ncbi:MAG: hypothetical protein V1921_06630 [Candidatus Altiarchaeota archaeon]
MTGTKVVKLKLEAGGDDSLPLLKDPIAEKIATLYKDTADRYRTDPSAQYMMVEPHTRKFNLNSGQIQTILLALEKTFGEDEHFHWRAGIILSALINNSKDKEFRIKTATPLSCLGYNLKGKKLVVDGDVGNLTGAHMINGELVVNGNAGDNTGWDMHHGRIRITGNAGARTGHHMSGDTIIKVEGDAGAETGHLMHDGVIDVGGRIESISRAFLEWPDGKMQMRGEIWNKGEKVWPK